jgi:hypothetical protein
MSIATYDLASLTYDSATTDYDGGGLGLSNMPVVGVFISFTDGPYVVDPNWVEVTQYVRDINVKRGRGNDLQQFPSGSATLTLDNRARLFDPFNTAGTYYGNLLPRRQIKIVGQWAGVTYPIFRGFIAGWPVGYSDGGKDSTVQIDCFDLIGLMAAEAVQGNRLMRSMQSFNPAFFFPFDESFPVSETVNAAGQVTNRVVSFSNIGSDERDIYSNETPSFGNSVTLVPSIIPAVETQAISLTGSGQLETNSERISTASATRKFTVMFWYAPDAQYGNTRMVHATSSAGGSRQSQTTLQSVTNNMRVVVGSAQSTGATAMPFGEPHMVAWTNSDDGSIQVYIDGVDVSSSITISLVNDFTFPLSYIQFSAGSSTVQVQRFQYYACYYDKLTAAQIADLYNLSKSSKIETAFSRINTYLSETSLSPLMYSVSTSLDVTVNEISSINESLLPLLYKTVKSEDGNIYVDRSGILQFVGQQVWAETRSAVSQMTFTDTGTGTYYDYASLQLGYDADLVRNDIKIGGSFNLVGASSSAASIAANGVAGDSVDTAIAYKSDADTLASYLVAIYKNPKLRVEPFMVKGQRNPSYDWPRLLSLELLDRFTFIRTPSTGSAITQDMLLQSIEHRITPGTWETVVNGSARFTGWFIIGTSLIGGTDVLL